MKFKYGLILATLLLLFISNAQAQIHLPKVIGTNMVLQRNQPVPVWGWVKPGGTVKLTFAGQQKGAIADQSGYWKVILNAMSANAKPQTMIITSDTSKVTLTNILVGEVWLCSGQSNMEYTMDKKTYSNPAKGVDSAALELSVNNPQIRLFKVEKVYSLPDVTSTGWNEAGGPSLASFSAAGYYFAKNIYNKLHIPIGMMQAAWGGSRIEPWTPAEAYAALPAFASDNAKQPGIIDSATVGKMYKSMVLPLQPYALRGFLWYQGESNCMINEQNMRYADKMQALVDNWRKGFNEPKAPFYSVLIAPYYYTKRKDHVPHTPETLPEFWEQQIESTRIPYTDIITVTDLVDDFKNIHPSYKWEVGRRLSLLALAKDYGYKKTVYSGPRYQKMEVKGNKIWLYFANATRLNTSDGKPANFFTIAGSDGKFVNAIAEIHDNVVIVSNPEVTQPKTVRLGWTETATPNLVNGAGLPSLPFRTDGKHWDYKAN